MDYEQESENSKSDESKKEHQISTISFVLMLSAMAICDAISFGLAFITIDGGVLNWVFGLFVDLSIWLWTAMNGMGWKGAALSGASFIVEFLPWIGSLPTFSAAVITIFIMSRAKEKLGQINPQLAKLATKIK